MEIDAFCCDDGMIYAADEQGREWRLDLDDCSAEVEERAAVQEQADQAAELAAAVQAECRAELLQLCREYGEAMPG